MAKLTPVQIAEKQVRRSTAAVSDYKDGINSVTESPTAKAALAVDSWQQGVQNAVADGSFVDGCNSVSLADWKKAASEKGGSRYAQGVTASAGKIQDFHTQIAPHREAVQQTIAGMPKGSYDERIQRMVANADGMHTFKYKPRRR